MIRRCACIIFVYRLVLPLLFLPNCDVFVTLQIVHVICDFEAIMLHKRNHGNTAPWLLKIAFIAVIFIIQWTSTYPTKKWTNTFVITPQITMKLAIMKRIPPFEPFLNVLVYDVATIIISMVFYRLSIVPASQQSLGQTPCWTRTHMQHYYACMYLSINMQFQVLAIIHDKMDYAKTTSSCI